MSNKFFFSIFNSNMFAVLKTALTKGAVRKTANRH